MSNSTPNFFDPESLKALGEEQRKAMMAAFEAMANWRQEVTSMQEKGSAAMFEKMSAAAKALGWPTEFVDLTREQILSVTKMQNHVIDQIMDTWKRQAAVKPGTFELPQMTSFPGMPNASSVFPNVKDMTPMAPLQIWMQAADMWQKNWQNALAGWMETQKSMMDQATGRKK